MPVYARVVEVVGEDASSSENGCRGLQQARWSGDIGYVTLLGPLYVRVVVVGNVEVALLALERFWGAGRVTGLHERLGYELIHLRWVVLRVG